MQILQKISFRLNRGFRRIKNNRCLYEFADQSGGWVKKGQLKLEGLTGSVFDPYVLISDRIRLYYSDRARNAVMAAESEDGENWTLPCPVLTGGGSGAWDETVNRACVLCLDGQYRMWFTGQYGGRSAIGAAVSSDGIHFERLGREPVLVPEQAYEGTSVMNPCVLWEAQEQCFRMWYSAGETYEPDVICCAVSKDGVSWEKTADLNPVLEKSAQRVDCCKVGGCDVHRLEDGSYRMYYIGYQNVDVARICAAESPDGVTGWKRCPTNPILAPSRGAWDSDAVYKPCAGRFRGKEYLWYNGRQKNTERIGYAVRELPER